MLPSFNYFKDPNFISYFRAFTKKFKLSTVTQQFLKKHFQTIVTRYSLHQLNQWKKAKQPEFYLLGINCRKQSRQLLAAPSFVLSNDRYQRLSVNVNEY